MELLAWFLAQASLMFCLSKVAGWALGCFSSLVGFTRWSGLGTLLCSTQQQVGLWVSIPALVGQQDGPWDLHGLFFERLESGKTALNSLARRDLVLLCRQGKKLVCFLLKCLYKSGCWVNCAASHMLWLGSLVGWAEGFPGASGKEPSCHCRRCKRCGFDPSVRKIPWRRAWKPTLVFLPGESLWTEEPGGL